MIYYEDLLSVPYKEKGRTMDGLDCYGLVIELCKRNNTPLYDITDRAHMPASEIENCLNKINIKEITKEEIRYGDIIQCIYNNNLHIGFILDKNLVIHMTAKGVRITPMQAFKSPRYGRIING